MNENQVKQAMHGRNYGRTVLTIPPTTVATLIRDAAWLNSDGVLEGIRDSLLLPNRSSVDTVLNNHRTLDGMDHPHARLIAKIRTALCNLPASRQDEYLKSLRLL